MLDMDQLVETKFQQALVQHRRNDLEEAQRIYQEILEIQSDHVDSLHLMGVARIQQGQLEAGVALIAEAIRINPCFPEAYSNQSVALWKLNRLDEALSSCEAAIRLKPDYPEAYLNRGNVFLELKRFDEALTSYEEAIRFKPDYAEAYLNLGNALQELKRFEEAWRSYDEAIRLKPDYAGAYSNLGNALQELKRFDQALMSCEEAIRLRPDYAEAYLNRGNVLQELNRFDEARRSYDEAIRIKPDYAEAYSSLGNMLRKLKCFDEALTSYEQAIRFKPDYAEAYSNLGNVLQELKRFDEALMNYGEAIRLEPDLAEARWNTSLTNLLLGDFEQGWLLFENRWQTRFFRGLKKSFSQPLWLGNESLMGKTILLHNEQGLGDTIQFIRYAKKFGAVGAKVVLQVQNTLKPLLQRQFDGVVVTSTDDPLPEFDCHCPLLSLPLAFKTTLQTIPGETQYVYADPQKTKLWDIRLGEKLKPRIGLAWSGNKGHHKDHVRSIPFKEMLEYLPDGAEFLCIQNEIREEDMLVLRRQLKVKEYCDDLHDFSDTAALVECVDLVVSVDTSLAHLAGAMGKTTWLLIPYVPDWRWLLDREDSPWYPSIKLYRQNQNREWQDVLARLRLDLCAEFERISSR